MSNLRIALFNTEEDAYSQTFVRDHITRLPGTVIPVFGSSYYWRHDHQEICPLPFRLVNHFCFRDRFPEVWVRTARAQMQLKLARFLRNQRIHVVLAEFADSALSLVEPCRAAGIPLVVYCHGYDVYVRTLVESRLAEYETLFRSAAAIIVVSRTMRQRVLELGAPDDTVHINPCGVDLDVISPAEPNSNPPHLIAVGRFVEKKAPHLTILAFHETRKVRPDAHLSMVGDGPLFDACRQLARALGLSEAVTFLAQQDHGSVLRLLRGARAFVQHSLTAPNGDSEGTPVSVLEAGAASLPVVATRHAGIVDTIIEGETGLLVDEFDTSSMARYMTLLVSDPALASVIGKRARSHISEYFSMQRSIGRLHDILVQAAARLRGH